jgi:hypothetical protein
LKTTKQDIEKNFSDFDTVLLKLKLPGGAIFNIIGYITIHENTFLIKTKNDSHSFNYQIWSKSNIFGHRQVLFEKKPYLYKHGNN